MKTNTPTQYDSKYDFKQSQNRAVIIGIFSTRSPPF